MKEKIEELLQEERKKYNRLERVYDNELREFRRQTLKEELIRSDERIEVYKKFLKMM